jgi:hypothetical protein
MEELVEQFSAGISRCQSSELTRIAENFGFPLVQKDGYNPATEPCRLAYCLKTATGVSADIPKRGFVARM